MDAEGLEIQSMPTIGKDITNQVFFTDVFVADEYMVGLEGQGFRYISEALDLERFTMFTFSPIQERTELISRYVKTTSFDGKPLREDPVVRQKVAQLETQTEVARVLGLRFVAASIKGGKPPTVEASTYKLYATQLSQRAIDMALDVIGHVPSYDMLMEFLEDDVRQTTKVCRSVAGRSRLCEELDQRLGERSCRPRRQSWKSGDARTLAARIVDI